MFWTQLRRRLMIWRRPTSTVRMLLPGRGPMRVVYDKAVVHESYSFRARVLQRAARLVFKPLLRFTPLNDRSLATIRAVDKLSARRPRSPYVESIRFELGGVPVESMVHRYGTDQRHDDPLPPRWGFFSGSIETHRRICERLARKTGATVISVDYVQLPEGSIADSVQDVITAYEALLEQTAHPDKIVVAGDSAGGYLTMKVAELATRRGLQAPAALLCFSPLLSVDPDREDKAVAAHHPVARRLPAGPAHRPDPRALAARGLGDRGLRLTAARRGVHHLADVPGRGRGRDAPSRGRGDGAAADRARASRSRRICGASRCTRSRCWPRCCPRARWHCSSRLTSPAEPSASSIAAGRRP